MLWSPLGRCGMDVEKEGEWRGEGEACRVSAQEGEPLPSPHPAVEVAWRRRPTQ